MPSTSACVAPVAKLTRVATGRFEAGGIGDGGIGVGGMGVGASVEVASGAVVGCVVAVAEGCSTASVLATIVEISLLTGGVGALPQADVVKIRIAIASLTGILRFSFIFFSSIELVYILLVYGVEL